jgi:hypothetical protein
MSDDEDSKSSAVNHLDNHNYNNIHIQTVLKCTGTPGRSYTTKKRVRQLFISTRCSIFPSIQQVYHQCAPAHAKSRLQYYYEKKLCTDAVQGYQFKDESKDCGEFIYIYWPATAGTCIKIPGAKNYEQ